MALFVSLLVLSTVSPASAHGTGTTTTGGSNIHASDPANDPEGCILASTEDGGTTTRIVLFSTGTFNGVAAVSHRATFTTTESYYFNASGTYSDSACTTAYAVPGTLSVGGGGSSASCTDTSATYQRVNTTYTIQTTSQTSCTVTVLGTTTTDTANFTYTGTQRACNINFDPTAVCTNNPQTSNEFTGSYTQN